MRRCAKEKNTLNSKGLFEKLHKNIYTISQFHSPPKASERHMGKLMAKCDHFASLSPVHMAANRCEPEKCPLVRINGLRLGDLLNNP